MKGHVGESFGIFRDVRQRYVMSLWKFSLFMDLVLKKL